MSVQIHLDQHHGPFYTNLDVLSGRVILTLNGDTPITAINVKLEGESRTKLAGPRNPNDRPEKIKTEVEHHKLLYKVQTVFPSQEILQHASNNAQFTLGAGVVEYPFKFKFPFNSDCKNTTPSALQDLKFGQLNVQFMQGATKHLKRALPPSLGGFPGEADIRYFVKVTVVRPKFYHENLRMQYMLKFMPIENPRPKNQNQEQYARRHHQFQGTERSSISNLFSKSSEAGSDQPLGVRVDARLPNPAILTCNKPVPLRVLVERTTSNQANIYLSMFHIELIAFTRIKANVLERTEITSFVLVSKANMDMVLGERVSKKTKELQIPQRLWDEVPLPSSVIPSFETCNLSRHYELEVRVGLSHSMTDSSKPEMIVLPLRIPCQVWSGIMPPKELLLRVNAQGGSVATGRPSASIPPATASPLIAANPHTPVTPMADSAAPPSTGSHHTQHAFDSDPNDLPPSYEDAMAEDIGPVDGPRQHFETSMAAQHQEPAYSGDSKSSGGLRRHPSERLFSQNAPRAPGVSPRYELSSDQANTVYEEASDDDLAGHPIDGTNEDGVSSITQPMANVSMDSKETSNRDISEPSPPPLPARKYTKSSNDANTPDADTGPGARTI